MAIPEMPPIDKAKELLHRTFKLDGASPFVAKQAARLIATIFIEEHQLLNNDKGIQYWKKVRNATKKL